MRWVPTLRDCCSLLLPGKLPNGGRMARRNGWRPGSARSSRCFASLGERRRLVFLGTPEVAAQALQQILDASSAADSAFEVAAVVSQPGRAKGRGSKRVPQPSPVEALAREQGVPGDRIWCPVKASERDFLENLGSIRPDLCVTAAYGNILPSAFLAIPKYGTLNIHPSLLPKYRGAAPVQRALQDGCATTGVSVAFTVRAMDAGPVLAREEVAVGDEIRAPELLADLFARGARLLLQALPSVWTGKAAGSVVPQDEAAVVLAPKLAKEEGILDFREGASALHNKVRAFAGWPGTTANFVLHGQTAEGRPEPVKVLRTRMMDTAGLEEPPERPAAVLEGQRLLVFCGGDGGCLEILEIQPLGKKPMPVSAFLNGLNGRTVRLA